MLYILIPGSRGIDQGCLPDKRRLRCLLRIVWFVGFVHARLSFIVNPSQAFLRLNSCTLGPRLR